MRRFLFFFIFLFLFASQQLNTKFNTISDLVEYAQRLPEFPENEYIDPYSPYYKRLHQELEPSSTDTILSTLGIKNSVLYDDIKDRLRDVISKRELQGFYGDFVQKFYIDVETKWYIWGPLHGAFHSLVRSLNELKSQGVIDDHLKLIKSRFNFVFNGNTLNYAPYQLETLYVLLRLMEQNPEQVFILKGKFEDNDNWKKTNLPRELRARLVADDAIPLERELSHFFNTLPLALYLLSTEFDVVRLSFYEQHLLLKDEEWGSFLNKKTSESKKIKDMMPSDEEVHIRARVSSHDVQEFPYKIDSIEYKRLDNVHGWRLFSSPIRLFRQMFSFDDDTVTVLTTGKFFSNWHLELYQQSTKDPKGFIRSRKFSIATGKEVFTANQKENIEELKQKIELAQLAQKRLKKKCGERTIKISKIEVTAPSKNIEKASKPLIAKDMALHDGLLVVGNTTDFSKGSKDWSKLLKKGLTLPVKIVNKHGGVDGTLIQLIFLDDQYNPELARKNIQNFLNDFKTDIILGAKGTSTLAAYIDLVKEKKVLAVFPNTGGFRDPEIPYLLHLRASYDDEGQAVAQYVLKKAKKKSRDMRFAFFYQKDDYGRDLLEGAKKILKKAGHSSFLEVPYEAYMTDFSEQVQQIKDFKPDMIGFFSLPDHTYKLMRQLGVRYLSDKVLFGNDRLGQQTFRDFLVDRGLVVVIPQIVPNPHTSNLQIAREFRSHARKNNVPIDTVSFEAYIQSALFIQLLKELKEPFTKEGFVKLFESLSDYDFKGLRLTFDPLTRQLFHTVWIDIGTDDWVKEEPEEVQVAPPKKQAEVAQAEMSLQDGMLVVGSLQDLSKTVKRTSVPFTNGLQMAIKYANEENENDKKVRIVVLDDEYDPKKTREQIARFGQEFKTDIILSAMGTPTLASYLDLIKDRQLLSIFPYSGSYGTADLTYLINLRVSNFDMGYTLTRYILSQYDDVKKIAFLYQNDTWGVDTLAGAQQALQEKGVENARVVSYEPHQSSFEDALKEITEFDPQAIGFLGISFASRNVIHGLGGEFLLDKILFGTDAHGKKEFKDFLDKKGLKFTIAQVVPNPEQSQLPIVKEYREQVKRNGIKNETISLEGYINGMVFVDVLSKLKGLFSKDALVKQFESIKDYDYKGLNLNFDPEKRQLLHNIWIDTGQDEWIVQEVATGTPVIASRDKVVAQKEIKVDGDATVVSGLDMAQQGDVLVIGTLQDLSKSVKDIGIPFKKGLFLPIDEVNSKGGVNGLQIRLVALDDQYNPNITRTFVEQFLTEYHTGVLLGAQGTPTLASYLDLIRQKKILSVFPYVGSYGELALPYLLRLRASYIDIGYALTKFMIDKRRKRKFALFYQDDHFGGSNLIGAKRALKEAGIDDYLEVPYQSHDPVFDEQAKKIEAYKPEAIALFGVPFASERLLNMLPIESLLDKEVFANEFHGDAQFREFVEQKGVAFVTAHVMPNPHTSSLPIVEKYRTSAKRANVMIDEGGLEGYVTAALFIDLLKRMVLPFTKEKLVELVEHIKDYDFEGLKLNFDPKTRQVFKTIWIDTGKGDWIEQKPVDEKAEEIKVEVIETQTKASSEPEIVIPEVSVPEVSVPEMSVPEMSVPDVSVPEISVQGDVLVLGNSSDYSKTIRVWSKDMEKGMMLPINQVNEKGGINGLRLRVVFLDDGYEADKARNNIDKFLTQFKTDILLGAIGTPTLRGYIDLVKDKKILSIFPNSSSYRDPSLTYLVHWRASNNDLGYAITEYIHKSIANPRLAFVYQDDPFGQEQLQGAKKYLAKAGISDFIALPHKHHESSFKDQVKKIKEYKANAIGMFTNQHPVELMVKDFGGDFFVGKTVFGSDVLNRHFFDERGIRFIAPSVVPNPISSQIEIVKKFRNDIKGTDVSANIATLEGYINGVIFLDLMSKIDGSFSKQAFLDVVKNIKDYNLQGLALHFDPNKRQLMHTLWIDDGKEDWHKISVE